MIWALVVFVLLNILDGFTTWLGLYHLPVELRGREANVIYKDAEHSFWPAMLRKGLFVILALWVFLYLADLTHTDVLFSLYVLNLVMVFTVINNSYVYLSRRITRRVTRTPVDVIAKLLRNCRLPKKAARIIGFYVLLGITVYVSYLIIGAVL